MKNNKIIIVLVAIIVGLSILSLFYYKRAKDNKAEITRLKLESIPSYSLSTCESELTKAKENLDKANYRIENARKIMERASSWAGSDYQNMSDALEDLGFEARSLEMNPVNKTIGQ
jgi:hypothetical protein